MSLIPGSPLLRALSIINFCLLANGLWSQCTQTVMVTITSIDFRSGCDFDESNGLDAVLEVRALDDSDIYLSEFENLSQVRNPQDSVLLDLSVNPNSCGNNDVTFSLGTFPVSENNVEVKVDIFDRDNIFPCAPYFGLFDDDLGRGNHTFDFDADRGTIDAGTCMLFNYELEYVTEGYEEEFISDILCYNESIVVNGKSYDINTPNGKDTILSSVSTECDTIINIDFTFLDEPIAAFDMQIVSDTICVDDMVMLSLIDDYDSYNWGSGQMTPSITTGSGTYVVTVTDDNGCTSSTAISIYNYPEAISEIIGDTIICNNNINLLSLSGNNYQSILWSDGSIFPTLIAGEPGDYSVELIDVQGCYLYDTISIVQIINTDIIIDRQSCDPMMVGTVDSVTVADNGCEQIYTIVTRLADESLCTYNYTLSNIAEVTCGGNNGIVEIVVTEGEVPYQISIRQDSPDDTEILTSEIFSLDSLIRLENLFAGSYSIVIQNERGDMISASFNVNEEPINEYSISDNIQIERGDTATLSFIDFDNSASLSQWIEDGNVICEDCDIINVAPLVTTTYIVQVTDLNGCDQEFSVTVVVTFESNKNVYIPNIINLSASDENRILKISGPDISNFISLNVYDRWGSVVYSDKGVEANWNGTSDNQLVNSGLYILCAEIRFSDGEVIKRCQDITVVR